MTGIENIIRKIEEDAEITAASIISEAEKKAASVVAEAEASGDALYRDIIAQAEAESAAMINKAHSGGELARKKTILSRRVEIMDSTISNAIENFLREDPAKYFDAMLKLASEYALEGEQEMIFSDRDMARLPADFDKKLKEAVGKKAKFTIRGGGSFDGGFLLVSNDMVENCTVKALVSEADTDIRDELCKILFTN